MLVSTNTVMDRVSRLTDISCRQRYSTVFCFWGLKMGYTVTERCCAPGFIFAALHSCYSQLVYSKRCLQVFIFFQFVFFFNVSCAIIRKYFVFAQAEVITNIVFVPICSSLEASTKIHTNCTLAHIIMHRGITWQLVNIRTYTQTVHQTKISNRRIAFNAISRHALA